MKFVTYKSFGNPLKVLELVEDTPQPLAEGEARIAVVRAPINPSDLAQIGGLYGMLPDLPARAGMEGLGRVVEVNGSGIEVGQLTLLPPAPGTWATEKVGKISDLMPLPEGDVDQLSMLLVNPATAHLMLTRFEDLQAGDWVIQSAANSAVGAYVNQLAKAQGIHVANVVRRDSAAERMKADGIEAVFVDSPDLAKQVEAETGAKMKLAIDPVAGDTFGRLAETLAPQGTLVLYGALGGVTATLPYGTLLYNDIHVRGFWLAKWFQTSSKSDQAAVYAKLTEAIATGVLKAPVAAHFGLDQIKDAVAAAMAGERDGKILLAPNGI